MLNDLYQTIIYLLNLTVNTDSLWIVIPLLITTFLMVIYFGIYKKERADWNTHFSNSFVLVFVSIALFRYIFLINDGGAFNFINYWGKSLATILLLAFGLTLVNFNFGHILPEGVSRYLSSPLTVNLFGYAIILLVYSEKEFSWIIFFSLIIIISLLFGFLLLIRIPLAKVSYYLKKEKKLERRRSIKEANFQIKELKKELKYREKELKKFELKKLEEERKETIRLEKELKK